MPYSLRLWHGEGGRRLGATAEDGVLSYLEAERANMRRAKVAEADAGFPPEARLTGPFTRWNPFEALRLD